MFQFCYEFPNLLKRKLWLCYTRDSIFRLEEQTVVKKAYPIISICILLCLLFTALPLAFAQAYETGSDTPAHREFATDREWDALQRINALRLYHGEAPLAMAARMQPVAALRASELDQSFSGTRPNGSHWYTALDEADISYDLAAELMARPAISGLRVVEMWARCETSLPLLLGEFTHIALGHNISTDTWSALLIQGEPHTALALHPQGGRHLPFGGPLASLHLIAVAKGGVGMSYIPLTDAMVPITRSGNVTLTFSWGGLQLHFTIFVDFSDVDEEHRYYECIRFVVTNGLFNGVSAINFDPDAPMTRAMFVTVLGRQARQMGLPITGDHSIFNDVADDTWYTPYIGWAAERGIAQGFGGHFGVNDPVTREQMATFLLRFIHYAEIEHDTGRGFWFRDRDLVAPWAIGAVDTTLQMGLIHLEYGYFNPDRPATRAEVAHALSALVRDYVN